MCLCLLLEWRWYCSSWWWLSWQLSWCCLWRVAVVGRASCAGRYRVDEKGDYTYINAAEFVAALGALAEDVRARLRLAEVGAHPVEGA